MSNQNELINIILESPDFDNEFEAKACAERIVDAGWVHESEIKICKECVEIKKYAWPEPKCSDCHGKGWVRKEAKA